MSDPAYFNYRPGEGKGEWDVRLDDSRLSVAGGWAIDLSDVTRATFTNVVIRGLRTVRIELFIDKEPYALGFTDPDRGYRMDPHARVHLSLVVAILRTMADVCPNVPIALGVNRGGGGLFYVGLGSLIAGIVLVVSMFTSDVSPERMVAAGIPALGLVLVGAVLFVGRAPWKRASQVHPAALADRLEAVLEARD